MQIAITLMAVVGGMILSLAVALLAEELIFGQLIRVFFVRRAVARHAVAKKDGPEALRRKGERRCWH